MVAYTVTYDPTGRPTGILADSGATIPLDRGNSAFQQFLAWNAQQQPPLDYTTPGPRTIRVARTVLAIYNDLVALSGPQKTNIWNYLTGVSPVASPSPLTQDNRAGGLTVFALWRRVVNETGLTAAQIVDIKTQAAAIYAYDFPSAFVTPTWDATINIAGDQPG